MILAQTKLVQWPATCTPFAAILHAQHTRRKQIQHTPILSHTVETVKSPTCRAHSNMTRTAMSMDTHTHVHAEGQILQVHSTSEPVPDQLTRYS